MAKFIKATHGFDHFAAGGKSWPESKIHLSYQPCHRHTREELCVHPEGLESRPKSASRHRPIRTCHNAYSWVLKLGSDTPQQSWWDVHVAVAHDQNAVLGARDEARETMRFSVRHDRFPGLDKMDPRPLRKLTTHLIHNRDGGVGERVDREQNFVVRIILGEEAAQIFFETIVLSTKRFQNADGWQCCGRGWRNCQVSARRNLGKDAVNPRASKQQNKEGHEDRCQQCHISCPRNSLAWLRKIEPFSSERTR